MQIRMNTSCVFSVRSANLKTSWVMSGMLIRRLYLRSRKGVSSKCFPCSRINRQFDKATTTAEREKWRKQKELHLGFVFLERVLLNSRELLATIDGRRMHITMDGWDSCKTVVPNYNMRTPELSGRYADFLKTKLTGVLVTGWKLIMLRSFPWVRTGANMACTALVHSLCVYQAHHPDVGLPSALELLVDGGSENVNKTFLGLAAWLVTMDVFQTVDVIRLPVGHTHNGLDQRFQKPSVWFHGDDAREAVTPVEWKTQVRPNTEPPTPKNPRMLHIVPRTRSRIMRHPFM